MSINNDAKPAIDCSKCRFSTLLDTGAMLIGSKLFECRRNPPVFVMIQTPQGVAPAFGFPQVTEKIWCHSYEYKHVISES